MKKHLIAAAVAAAVAVPAMAQNVTVYGRLDAGYTKLDNETNKTSGIRYNTFTTSRLGVTGTEDLGGGLKATFTLEGGIGAGPGLTPSTSVVKFNGGAYALGEDGTQAKFDGFNRLAFAEINGGFGALRAGLDNSVTKVIYDSYDAGGANNVIGSGHSTLGTQSLWAARDTAVRYTTPKMNGFQASFGVLNQETNGNKTGQGNEFSVNYSGGPLSAAAAVRKIKLSNSYDLDTMTFAAGYDFGVAKVTVIYGDNEREGATKIDSNMLAVGIAIPVGAARLFATYADGEQAQNNADAKGYQVGAQYNLSKRTYGYAAIGKTDVNTSATAKVKTDQYGVGIVHMF